MFLLFRIMIVSKFCVKCGWKEYLWIILFKKRLFSYFKLDFSRSISWTKLYVKIIIEFLEESYKFASILSSSFSLWWSDCSPCLKLICVIIIVTNFYLILIILVLHSLEYTWMQRGIINWLLFNGVFVCMQILYLLQISFDNHAELTMSISRIGFVICTITNHCCVGLSMNLSFHFLERSTLLNADKKLPFPSFFFRIEFLTGKRPDCGLASSL